MVELMHTLLMLEGRHITKGMDDAEEASFLWQAYAPDRPCGGFYHTWDELWIDLFDGVHHSCAIAIGLYRPDHEVGDPHGYVIANPPKGTDVHPTDLIIVFASKDWGHWAANE